MFEVVFVSPDPAPPVERVAAWLLEEGEPVEAEPEGLALRALPVRLGVGGPRLTARVTPGADTPLERLVNLLFNLSVRLGADVYVGDAPVHRGALWLTFASEQDRARIVRCLDRANERGNTEVARRLWTVLGALAGRDRSWRWDTRVGGAVAWSDAEGDDARPVEGSVYLVLWRWLSEAYPGLV